MRRKLPLVLIPLAAILAVTLSSQGDAPAGSTAAATPSDTTANAAGMRLYVDPVTKEFVDKPVEPLTPEAFEDLQALFNTSHVGLIEVAAPVGGGKMVNLKGRFQHAYTATRDASGDLSAGCGLHQSLETATPKSEKESD
jgi:hypothetical protein